MLTEAQCPPTGRFLLADGLLTDRAIRFIQAECVRRNRGKDATAAHQQFAGWVRQANQVALFTLYAYADRDLSTPFFIDRDSAQYFRYSVLFATEHAKHCYTGRFKKKPT